MRPGGEAHVPVLQTLQNYRLLCAAALLFAMATSAKNVPNTGCCVACGTDAIGSRSTTAAVALMLKTHLTGTWNDAVTGYVVATEFARQKFIDGGLPAKRSTLNQTSSIPIRGSEARLVTTRLFVGRLSPGERIVDPAGPWEGSIIRFPW